MKSEFYRRQLKSAQSPGAKKVILSRLRDERRREKIQGCTSCGLSVSRGQAVPWSGPTNGRADLLLVGEAPGAEEDKRGVPFVGRSGRLLDELLEAAGTQRSRVFVCNTLCCRPPGNRDPEANELASCRPNFDMQLDVAGVHVGVALGGYAIANVLGQPRDSIKVFEHVSKPVWKDGRIWLGTYHPAYALRNPDKKDTIRTTLQLALALRFGRAQTPWPAWEQVDVLGKKGTDLGPSIDKQGWALAYWEALGQQVVVTDPRKKATIPSAIAHLPRYEVEELIAMGEIGKGRKVTAEMVQAIHMVKHEFGGTIMLEGR